VQRIACLPAVPHQCLIGFIGATLGHEISKKRLVLAFSHSLGQKRSSRSVRLRTGQSRMYKCDTEPRRYKQGRTSNGSQKTAFAPGEQIDD